jgi:ribonuclease HI
MHGRGLGEENGRLAKKKFYAIRRGHRPGIYTQWFGPEGAQRQVEGFAGAVYRGFPSRAEAEAFMAGASPPAKEARAAGRPRLDGPHVGGPHMVVYTDGGAIGNPGPGGYGVVIMPPDGDPLELSGGFRKTTNNRMELMACIAALEYLDDRLPIVLYSDSRYLVDAITKKWVFAWRRKGWKKADGQPAKNPDLWKRLLDRLDVLDVMFRWVKGHAGHEWNERCDTLAGRAMVGSDLAVDAYYEASLKDQSGR